MAFFVYLLVSFLVSSCVLSIEKESILPPDASENDGIDAADQDMSVEIDNDTTDVAEDDVDEGDDIDDGSDTHEEDPADTEVECFVFDRGSGLDGSYIPADGEELVSGQYTSFTILEGRTVYVPSGSPVSIMVTGNAEIAGTIEGTGRGHGGGAGGTCDHYNGNSGSGPGGGEGGSHCADLDHNGAGGGGGSYGSSGSDGTGGGCANPAPGDAGPTYGNAELTTLELGSGGGGGGVGSPMDCGRDYHWGGEGGRGGDGGGAIEIIAYEIYVSGEILMNGSNGHACVCAGEFEARDGSGSGGGGSGGSISLTAMNVVITGRVMARGGNGPGCGECGSHLGGEGGNGGSGRIKIECGTFSGSTDPSPGFLEEYCVE